MASPRETAGLGLIASSLVGFAASVYLAYTGYVAASLISMGIGTIMLITGADLLKD